MTRKLHHAFAAACLLGAGFSPWQPAVRAAEPSAREVLMVMGLTEDSLAALDKGQPVVYDLNEGSDDELAAGIVWYFPVSPAKTAEHLRIDNPDLIDSGLISHGMMARTSGTDFLPSLVLSGEEAQALLDVEAGDRFNLSTEEIAGFKTLKTALNQKPPEAVRREVEQHYRKILFDRFEAYRQGGTKAIAPYERESNRNSSPSAELRQAANSSPILPRYFPSLYRAWMDYPKPLPPGADEAFPWVQKTVEGRPAVILRHRISMDWNGGVLTLTREFYAQHSYNSSQWITGCLPYRDGMIVFQQVRSYTDQVAGIASRLKHMVGRRLLKEKMLHFFRRLCDALNQCHG